MVEINLDFAVERSAGFRFALSSPQAPRGSPSVQNRGLKFFLKVVDKSFYIQYTM